MATREQFETSNRLSAIAERVGHAVWSLQILEHSAAVYLALAVHVHAKPDMGREAGQKLLTEVERLTFGQTIRRLIDAESLPGELRERFAALLGERNWLIHRSRLTERRAPFDDGECAQLIDRANAIKAESSLLHDELRRLGELFARAHGIDPEEAAQMAEQQLREWKGDQP